MSEKASESLPVFAPVHLRGAEEIAQVFGVHVLTVRQWKARGAPIFLIGKKCQANYFDLWEWLKQRNVDAETKNA